MDPEKSSYSADDVIREAAPVQAAANVHEDEPQIYNVMPRLVHKNGVSQPAVQVTDNSIDGLEASSGSPASFLKIFKIGILLLLVLGLGFAGYLFGPKYYKKFFVKDTLQTQQTAQPDTGANPDAQNSAPTTTPDQNTDSGGLPTEWLQKYFGVEKCEKATECGPEADPDMDGLTNLEENQQGTDPNNSDSDGDGLSDGDEVHIFVSNPLKKFSYDDPKYNDADYIKGGYDLSTTQLMTQDKIQEIKTRLQQQGVHPPTFKTLGDTLKKIYGFGENPSPVMPPEATTTPTSTPDKALEGLEVTPEAQQDRDAQRTVTIKNIGIGLIKYHDTNKEYPQTTNFKEMYDAIRVSLKVATNPQDPVNKEPYVYSYTPNAAADDFTISYYSEVARQLIKKHASEARKDLANEEAAINDDQRMNDLKRLQTALLLYSSKQSAGNTDNVFPSVEKYKTELLASGDISDIPKDPKTAQDYEYKVSDTFDTFTLKATLDNPPTGSTGYLCNQLECDYY